MKRDYIEIKEGLRRIRGKYNLIPEKTEKIRKLSDNIKQIEDFQKIVLMGIQERIYRRWEAVEKTGIRKDMKFLRKGWNYLKNAVKLFKMKMEKFFQKAKKILSFSNEQEDLLSLEVKKLPIELNERIHQSFWDGHLKTLNSILHDIPSFTREEIFMLEGNEISFSLKKNVLQTADYLYSHKIITGDTLGKFLKHDGTLKIAASTRAADFRLDGHVYWQCFKTSAVPILNEWHPHIDRRFYKGKLSKIILIIIPTYPSSKMADALFQSNFFNSKKFLMEETKDTYHTYISRSSKEIQNFIMISYPMNFLKMTDYSKCWKNSIHICKTIHYQMRNRIT
jgi:hypothetical protein